MYTAQRAIQPDGKTSPVSLRFPWGQQMLKPEHAPPTVLFDARAALQVGGSKSREKALRLQAKSFLFIRALISVPAPGTFSSLGSHGMFRPRLTGSQGASCKSL